MHPTIILKIMIIKKSKNSIRVAILNLLVSTFFILNLDAAQVIFVVKQSSSHPDSSASVGQYTNYTRTGNVTFFTLTSGKTYKANKFQLAGIYPYVNPKKDTIRPDKKNHYSKLLKNYEALSKRYKKSEPFLKKQIAVLREVVTNLNAGRAWYKGEWIEDSELERIHQDLIAKKLSEIEQNRIQKKTEIKQDEIKKTKEKSNKQENEIKDLILKRDRHNKEIIKFKHKLELINEEIKKDIKRSTTEIN